MRIKKLPLIFDKRLFVYLFLGFIVATVAGTLSHECGHYLAARYYGYKHTRINYASTIYGDEWPWRKMDSIGIQYIREIAEKRDFPLRKEYDRLTREYESSDLIITSAGPTQTMATGTIGLLMMFLFSARFAGKSALSTGQWLLVFLSLFWLREIFNLATAIILLSLGHLNYRGDEFNMAKDLEWPLWSISIATGMVSLVILLLIVFRFIPARQRLTFIIAGFTGGLTGAYLWLVSLGPKIMP